jgi:hypothetical protein
MNNIKTSEEKKDRDEKLSSWDIRCWIPPSLLPFFSLSLPESVVTCSVACLLGSVAPAPPVAVVAVEPWRKGEGVMRRVAPSREERNHRLSRWSRGGRNRRRRPRKPRNHWWRWECGLGLGFSYQWDIRIWEFGGLLVGCCLLGCLCM